MSKATSLKAYVVSDRYGYEYHCALVFATTTNQARNIAYNKSDLDSPYLDLQARRLKHIDTLARKQEPYIEYDLKVLREAGFQFEDGRSCDSCGLSDCDEDRWRVCCICRQCPECGYDKDCERHGKNVYEL